MKTLLFPRNFRTVGWLLFVPALIVGVLILSGILSLPGIWEVVVNDAVIIGIATGSLFIVCAKEVHEDEMTESIRLSALLRALYVYVGLLIVSTLVFNGFVFFNFMIANLALFPVIYVVVFRMAMYRYNKMGADEEQD